MAKIIRRYGIYWVHLDPVKGHEIRKTRPCVVVSPDAMTRTGMIVVCPLTSSLHPAWRHRLQIECAGQKAEIMPDQIRAITAERVGAEIGKLQPKDIQALRDVIVRLYGC